MFIVIFVTTKDRQEAEAIARNLVEEKLAACVNILDGVQSVFWWEGKVDQAQEALLMIKSRKDLLPQIITAVKSLHSYSVPEIIALPVQDGHSDYLKWIEESTRS